MSKKMQISCYGDPVTLEVTDNGDVIFHSWEQDAELVCIDLGFEPSLCFIIWKALNDGTLNRALTNHSQSGDAQAVKALLFVGADVHAKHDEALRWASEDGHTNVVKTLLEAGADVHALDDMALHMASKRGYADVVKILLEAGADVHALSDQALRVSSYKGHPNTVKILLEAGANIHAGTKGVDDESLLAAAEMGHKAVVKILLEYGADVHANNDLALRNTLSQGRLDVVKILQDWIKEQG